jgi:hypothetical protein
MLKVAKAPTKATATWTNKLAPQHSTLGAQRLGHGSVEDPLWLQRAIGNQVTLQLLYRSGLET